MTRQEIKAINHSRLLSWAARLSESHATPVVVVGVGHDHESGRVNVVRTEDGPSDEDLAILLRAAADGLDGGAR